jgi:Family of unknown function (DUF6221)
MRDHGGTQDLVAFLRARLDGEAAAAQTALDIGDYRVLSVDAGFEYEDDRAAKFVASWRPARVLAEVDTKRLIMQLCDDTIRREPDNAWYDGASPIDVAHSVLRLLALPYADHSDYDEAWRP